MGIYVVWIQDRDGNVIKKTDDGRKEVTEELFLKTSVLLHAPPFGR